MLLESLSLTPPVLVLLIAACLAEKSNRSETK